MLYSSGPLRLGKKDALATMLLQRKPLKFNRRTPFVNSSGCDFYIGRPQTCVCPDVCLGIVHVSGNAPLSGQGVGRYTMYLPLFAARNL